MSDQTITLNINPGSASWATITVNVPGDASLVQQIAKLTADLAAANATIEDLRRQISNLK
jgi:hypothetical protein